MAQRVLKITEEFGVWHIFIDGREVVDTALVNALAKAAVTSPRPISLDMAGTKLAMTAGVLEALMPPAQVDLHGPQST